MSFADILFYSSALVTIFGAFFVAFSRSVLYAGFSLLATLMGVAGLYLGLEASFLAVTQLLVYVGGIVILILFAVMLSRNLNDDDVFEGLNFSHHSQGYFQSILTWLVSGTLLGFLLLVIRSGGWNVLEEFATVDNSRELGNLFLGRFVLVFELSSLLLLGALLGAAVLARPLKNKEDK